MNPFAVPERAFVSRRPQDMRAGVDALAARVAAEGGDPADGSLWCFVGRDCRRMKMVRRVGDGWCLYSLRLDGARFRWAAGGDGEPALEFDRRELLFLLEGLERRSGKASPPAGDKVL